MHRGGQRREIEPSAAARARPSADVTPPSFSSQSALHWAPTAVPILPAAAVACLATVLPLAVYIGTAEEFDGVNPITPSGYARVARRTYAAFGGSAATGGRVGGKDL